jgi:hypothetical protein
MLRNIITELNNKYEKTLATLEEMNLIISTKDNTH